MNKQIQRDKNIYLAVDILGQDINGKIVVTDQRTNETLDPTNVDDKIKIYEREVEEWFLKPASKLHRENSFNNAFIVLMICMAYFEGVEQYKTGMGSEKQQSGTFFKNSIRRLYPGKYKDKDKDKEELDKLYSKSRCGLFHNGMVKGGVLFSDSFDKPIEFKDNGETIQINPRLLLEDIENDFKGYINELRNVDNRTTRENFDRMFNVSQTKRAN